MTPDTGDAHRFIMVSGGDDNALHMYIFDMAIQDDPVVTVVGSATVHGAHVSSIKGNITFLIVM